MDDDIEFLLNYYSTLKKFQVARDGELLGEFSEEEIRIKEELGELRPTDHILKEKRKSPVWVLLFNHTPSRDFFNALYWEEFEKAVLSEEKKAENHLKEFTKIAGGQGDAAKEAKKRIKEYQELLIYLSGIREREKKLRADQDAERQRQAMEELLGCYAEAVSLDDEYFDSVQLGVENQVSWLKGSFRGTKNQETYEEFLEDKYWKPRFAEYFPDISDSQKRAFYVIFKYFAPSDKDIFCLASMLEVTPRKLSANLIVSYFDKNPNELPLRCSINGERNEEEDYGKLKKYAKQMSKIDSF